MSLQLSWRSVVAVALQFRIVLFFGPILFALLVALLSDAALTWDGSLFFYSNLQFGNPLVAFGRYTEYILQAPVQLGSRLTQDLGLNKILFGVGYVFLPAISLGLSWFIVRKRSEDLFLWPALGVGLVALPAQFFFVSEAVVAAHLVWPALLALFVASGTRRKLLAPPLILALGFIHPFAILFIGLMGLGVAVFPKWAWARRRDQLIVAVALLAMAAALAIRFGLSVSQYEISASNPAMVWGALRGTPSASAASAAGIFCGLAFILAEIIGVKSQRSQGWFYAVGILSLIVAGVLMAYWVADPGKWRAGIQYRSVVPFLVSGLLVLAMFDINRTGRLDGSPSSEAASPTMGSWRFTAATVSTFIFAGTILAQSVQFRLFSNRLASDLDLQSGSCITTDEAPWVGGTLFAHWSVVTYSLVLQGRQPDKLMVSPTTSCSEAVTGQSIVIDPNFRIRKSGSYFDFSALR